LREESRALANVFPQAPKPDFLTLQHHIFLIKVITLKTFTCSTLGGGRPSCA